MKTVQDALFHFFSMLLNGAYASNLKLGGNIEFSWYSCNMLRYCSNRCIVWFFIPENCPAQANRKFPVQLYVKIQILLESPFWICKWANHLSFLAMWNIIMVMCIYIRACRWRLPAAHYLQAVAVQFVHLPNKTISKNLLFIICLFFIPPRIVLDNTILFIHNRMVTDHSDHSNIYTNTILVL